MPSAVDICNVALAHIGDIATVSSIDPPEGSAQAQHCARFYPIARDAALEMHAWNFSMRRVALAKVTNSWTEWLYAYAVPSNANNIISVIPSDALDDYSETFPPTWPNSQFPYGAPSPAAVAYVPQPYTIEIDATGTPVLLTNQEDAVLRYTAFVTDTTTFSPLFVTTLTYHLASMLAGPVIKGQEGRKVAAEMAAMAKYWLGRATASDATQRNVKAVQSVPWMAGR
jgi:hypothetical protein